MKKIIFYKIHSGVAFGIVLGASTITASLFLFLLISSTKQAEAFMGVDMGLQILTPPIKCIQDTLSPTCFATCPICGKFAGVCNSMFEVKAISLAGVNMLHDSIALCVLNPVPPLGGTFRPGSRCIGKSFTPVPYHILFNFACYP